MQSISPVTPAQLLAADQEMLMKFEIYVVDTWINLCALDAKNYVEGVTLSLGGAGMTPNPIGGTWSAMLSNENSIFHPQHPTSAYKDYLKTGREVRISIGAKYNDTDYYWQRVIGFIDEPRFEALDQKVGISGGDYMKLLQDTELRSPDNYWGTYETFSSLPSDGILGSELYNEVDAMDINNEDDNVDNWPVTGACTFESQGDTGGGSVYVGKLISTDSDAYTKNLDVGTVEAGKEYKVTFKYRRVTGGAKLRVSIWQQYNGASEHQLNFISGLDSLSYETATIYFTADVDGPIIMKVAIWEITAGTHQFRIDQISIWEFIPYEEISYQLPEASKGPYRVLLKQNGTWEDVWQGEEDEGWGHEESTRRVFFDHNKTVIAGTDNLKIYYYTTQAMEDIVADLLVTAGLYADRATALATMDYTDPAIDIDRVWFEAGTTVLDAVRKICERCNYRFHFKWDGTPVFKAKPSYSDALTDGGLNIWTTATNLTYWTEYKEGTSTINREATEKIEGDYSCRFDVDASNSQLYINGSFSMIPLKRHKIIIWYMNSVAGKTFNFMIYDSAINVFLKDDGTWQVTDHRIILPNSLVWTPFELEFYAHADYSDYVLRLTYNVSASSSIYFDKVSIWREEFTFTDQKHISSFSNYQDRGEIKNRIVIEGMKQAEPVNKEETIPPELRGEKSDATSIATYGERTLSIRNHLFQTQDSILNAAGNAGMCVDLLAERKDPRWYTDLEIPYNPAPLDKGDLIGWKERLSPTLEIQRRGVIRDIKIDGFRTTYKVEDPT